MVINLTQGKSCLVDDEDYEWLSEFSWCASRCVSKCNTSKLYAVSWVGNPKRVTLMHRFILNCSSGMFVDHINGDGLDNRRSNIRICSLSNNQANRGLPKNNTSGFKGVSFHKPTGKWRSKVKLHNSDNYLGLFNSPIDAALAYDEAAYKLHGEYARLNFPKETANV